MPSLYELLTFAILFHLSQGQQGQVQRGRIPSRAVPPPFAAARPSNPQAARPPTVDPAECPIEPKTECPNVRKALDEECAEDADCVVPGVCEGGLCTCPKDHLRKDYFCAKAPSYGQHCAEGQCKEPYVCTNGRYCDCPANMARTYFGCELECGEDEVATPTRCMKVAALGESCTSTLQCSTAYAECAGGSCGCVAGAVPFLGKECLPTYRCPNGDAPMKDPDSPFLLECKASTCPLEGAKADTCPEGADCVFPSYQNTQGFCCSSEPWCPAGAPLRAASCKNPKSEAERCPPDTHHCYTGERGTYCCPLPCPSIIGKPAVIVNGTCYPKKSLKELCKQTLQCPQGAECRALDADDANSDAVCACPKGTRQHFGSQGTICRRVCEGSQVLVGAECLSVAAPLQACRHSAQCVGGTKCVDEACRCDCGLHLYYGRCVARPSCRVYGSYSGDRAPLKDVNGEFLECTPGQNRRETACPDDAYCRTASLYSGGVCCPMPKPHCADGSEPAEERGCALRRVGECSQENYCRDYIFDSVLDAGEVFGRSHFGACCPRDTRRPSPPRPTASLKQSRGTSVLDVFSRYYSPLLFSRRR